MADDIFTSEPERIIAQRNHVHDLDRLAADRLEEENDPVATIARFSSANVSGGVREGLSISDAIDRLAEERMQRENLVKWQLVQASQTNPDAEARLQQRARQIGLPADVARDDPETVAMKAYRKQLEGKDFGNAPATLEVLSDPDVAKVAHDDTDNMFDLDNWHKYNPLAFALDAVRSLGAGLIGGSIRGTGGMVSTQVRAFPVSGVINDAEVNAQIMGYDTGNANERVAEAVKQGEELAKASGVDEIYNTGKEWTDAIRGDVSGYGFIGKSVLSGFESMGAMIPGMALSFVTKNPLPGLTAAGMMEGSDAIMEDLKAGKPFGEAILHGVINGSIEVGTEAIPMSKLINDVDIGKKLFSVLIRNWIRETPSEMIATAGQTLSDRIFAMKDGEPLSGTITQWAKELPAAEAETVLATMVMSFGMGAFGKGVRQIQTRQMSEAVASLNDNAKASKVRGRAKEIYERLAQTVGKNENIDNAYIDAERWNEYFQEIGEDPHAMAERFGVTNYEDGSVGSFLQIPFGKYQSDFSATEYAQAFVNDTKFSDTERTASEQARFIEKTKEELAETLRTLDEESGRATLVKDAIGRLTDKIAIQLENTYDKQTSRLQAEVLARMFSNTVVNDAISRGEQATPEALADMVDALFSTEGPSIRSGTGMRKRSVDPAIDAQLEKLRRNELPKERDVYGQSLMEYIRKKGGIRPDDITRDLVKNKQLPRSILNEKGMGADELASLQDVLDFGLDTETTQGDNALLDALVAEYTTGEKRYSNTQLNSELLSEAQTLNDLSRDLAAAGIDLSTHTDNAAIREALSKYYEEQNGENTREEPETSETLRYEQRGFTESDTPTAEERAEANRQYDEIEKKYKGTPLWMKAPNGEPTKLSERQWVQVRTPNFKRWFGDWEKTGIRERLENQEAVAVEAKYNATSPKERRDIALEFFPENVVVQKPVGDVVISRRSIRSSFSHGSTDVKLDVMPYLAEILEKSEYIDTLQDFDGSDVQNHYFATRITHGNQGKLVFMRARKMPGRENQLYVHDVFVEEEIKQKDRNNVSKSGYSQKTVGQLRGSDLYKSILQDIYATDNESVSKVVDSNGEPMVMYHQTRSRDITVFDIRRKGAGETDPETPFGVFLKPTDADIGLGNVQMALFANIRNPARFRNRESVERYLGEKADGYAQRRDWLKATDKDYLTKYEQAEAEADRILEEWEKNHPDSTEKEREEIFDKAYATADSVMDEWKTETDRISKEAKDIADNWFRKEGYDGFVLDEDSGSLGRSVQTTVALSNKQVKSATGNIGTFTDNPNILYQFIGEKGAAALDRANEATIRLDNLSVAREMATAGKDAKAIKFATGWERGADGKWRYEIDDSHSVFGVNGDIEFQKRHPEYQRMKELSEKFLFGELSSEELDELKNAESIWGREPERLRERLESGNATLPDVLDHPELFHAYPALKDVRVWITDPSREGNLGGYSSEDNIIFVSDKAPDKHSVLMHEIQHVVQRLEGFAQGTNMETVGVHLWDLYKDFENHWEKTEAPKYQEYRNVTDQLEKELKDMFEGVEGANERYAILHRKQQQLKEHSAVKAVNDSEKRIREKYDLGKGFSSAFVGKLSIGSNVWDGMLAHINRKDVLYTRYRRSAGETEARNTQSRLAMAPEQRRQSLASETEDVSREDQIFLYQSFGDENVPVVRLTGDELGVPIEAPLKEHIKAAKKYHDVLREESKTNPVIQKQLGKPVRFSAKGFKENAHSGADKRKWALFPKLREIIESSVLIETRNVKKQRKDNFTKFHWVEAPVNLNGKTLTVGITLAEDAEGNLFYNLNAEADSTRSAQKKETPSHFPGSQDQDYEGADSTSVLQQSQDVGGIPDTASDILEQSIGQNGDGVNLFISKGKTARGDIRGSYDYVNNIIRLTKAADYSTFVHESAHFMLEMVARMANQESASSYITKQYDTICEYLGAKKGERFTREQHETFARSFEAYLKEGKAPTPAVRNLFAKFADWLKHIYRSVSLHVTLNKDIREVFDRMIATEAELEMAKKQKEYTELFATAENAGLTREEFDLYRKTGEKELRIAQEKRRAKIFARAVRKKTKEYRIRKKAMERQVAADYDAMPIIRLMDALSDKDHPELAFNKGGLIDRYGKAYIGKLPRRNGRAIYHADGLMDLDDVAIDAGYESGDDLLRAWQELPTKKEFVAAETEKRLAETDRQMDYDVASEALDNEGHDERLKAELAIIRRLATFGKKAVRLHVIEEAKRRKAQITAIERDVRDQTEAMVFVAGDIIRNKTTGDIHPEMYRRAMQKAADQAYREIRKTKPDYEKAARAKQAEMMNHFLFREAMKAHREIERGTRKAKRVLNVKTETYRNRLDSLNANKAKFIAASLLGSARKEALLDAVHTEEKYEKEAAAQWLYDVGPMKTTPYRDVLIALDDMDAYYHDAQREKQVVIAGRRMDAIDVAGDLAEKVRQVEKSKYVTDNVRSVKNDVIDGLHFTKNILTRMEHLCYFFDGDRKGVGPWLKNVFAPTLAAGVRYRQRRDAVAKEFSEILDGFEFRKGVIHSEELDFTFGKGRRSSTGYAKAEIVALILQTGTESNLKKLLAGYGWTVVDWNRFIARMQQERILTEADMDRVQRIWDLFEANKEKSQRAYKYVYGRYFEEIPARPFMMFGKMYKGGYAPLVYDSRETDAGKKQESDFKEDMQALFPAPDAGFAKSRTEYIGELSLDIMRIQRGFKDQILFSEMGPVYADLQKIFRQPELSKALREYDDRLYARVIDPWMKRAVHQSIDTGRERSAADRIFRSLRNISSVTTMAGNVVNAVEGLTDVPAAVKVVGFRSFSDATKQFMASPRESQRMIRELSPYMNERMSAAYASLDARLEESVNPNKIQRWNRFISDHAFFVQTVFDRFIICPTWIASYNNALASGLTEEDAILKADSDVRRVQSDYSPESLSNLEAGSPFVRLFTQFTSYFITRGNLVASESSVAIRQGASKLAVMFGWMLMAGIPAWLSKALQMAASGSDDDREFSDWIVEIFGLGSLDYVLSMTGAGRYAATMINDIQQGRRFNYPAPGPFRALESLYSLAENRAKGDPVKLTQYLIEVSNAMPYTPVIPIRPVKSVGYVVHAVEGKIEPTGPVDFIRGTVTGRASADSRK